MHSTHLNKAANTKAVSQIESCRICHQHFSRPPTSVSVTCGTSWVTTKRVRLLSILSLRVLCQAYSCRDGCYDIFETSIVLCRCRWSCSMSTTGKIRGDGLRLSERDEPASTHAINMLPVLCMALSALLGSW